jgi:hypothetical protein
MRLTGKVDCPLHHSAQSFNARLEAAQSRDRKLNYIGIISIDQADRRQLASTSCNSFATPSIDVRDDETKWSTPVARGARPQSPSLEFASVDESGSGSGES